MAVTIPKYYSEVLFGDPTFVQMPEIGRFREWSTKQANGFYRPPVLNINFCLVKDCSNLDPLSKAGDICYPH